jgi:hypothetical protein
LGPRFGTPIWDPNVISKIKQNSSDMNEIILAPCDVISKIKQNTSDMNEIILAPCDAGYVQSCTGYLVGSIDGLQFNDGPTRLPDVPYVEVVFKCTSHEQIRFLFMKAEIHNGAGMFLEHSLANHVAVRSPIKKFNLKNRSLEF